MVFFHKIREPHKGKSTPTKFATTFICLLGGFGGAMLTQFLGTLTNGQFPEWLQPLHLNAVFTYLFPWAFAGLCIAVFSRTPLRAAINALTFFAGKLLGVYLYGAIFSHVPDFPYVWFWLIVAALAFPVGFLFWFARGKGAVAITLSAIAIGYFTLRAFVVTPTFAGFGINWTFGFLPLALLVACIGVLWRKPLQTLFSVLLGFAFAYIYVLLPFAVPLI